MAIRGLAISVGGWIELWESLNDKRSCTLYALFRDFWSSVTIYDASGKSWKVARVIPGRQLGALDKFLAYTFYNPDMEIHLELAESSIYTLEELRMFLCSLMDKDSGLLTQFVEPDEIKEKLQLTTSFDEIISVLKETGAV